MDKEVTVASVEVKETRNGNRRSVLRDSDGGEFTTFRPQIGEQAAKHVRIGEGEVPPDELFEQLKPFQERVAADIRDDEDE